MEASKRTPQELNAMPKPACPAELEVLSAWYFGKPLQLSRLSVFRENASYQVREFYNDYHGTGWLHSENSIDGYDYSERFWRHVVGPLTCGGIASHSYGQVHIKGHRDVARLKKFEGFILRKESGRLRSQFERLAREHGAERTKRTMDSFVQRAGREDGAATAFLQEILMIPKDFTRRVQENPQIAVELLEAALRVLGMPREHGWTVLTVDLEALNSAVANALDMNGKRAHYRNELALDAAARTGEEVLREHQP